MSADNWSTCPSCLSRAEEVKAAEVRAAQEAYGKVPVEEFDRLRAIAAAPINVERLGTFREDYELWLSGTIVEVRYEGRCTTCGSGVKFSDSRPIVMKEPP